ncbi:MAG TPA: hypothetical protein VN176_03645 [Verrucomicrobiae bacterium]|nr:hypothetical protein [Verrucomicrobiae bacterium]
MTVESWKTVFDIGTLVLLFVTAAFATGIFLTGDIINKRQGEQLRQFDKDLTEAKTNLGKQQERAAAAETALQGVATKTEGFRLAIAKANERASKAQESLALAEQHSAEANAKAEGFRRDIAQANERAAEANRIAEQERLARLQIEARLADRIISPFQEQKIQEAFAPLKGKTVEIAVLGDTMEIAQFANKIIEPIRRAGVLINLSRPLGGATARGVLVGIKADAPPELKQAANTLIAILQQTVPGGVAPWEFDKLATVGAAMVSHDEGAQPNSPLRIWIGSK